MDNDEAEELLRTYGPSVYRLAYARTGSHADAEDVMQEVFLKLLRKAPDFRDEEHRKAWLLRVAANQVTDLCRSAWRRRTGPLDETVAAPERPDGSVLDAVLALPEKYRMCVHLHYYEGLSVAETAAVLGRSESVVKTRLFRARAMLRDALGERGEDNA